jgi:hypothetical protein
MRGWLTLFVALAALAPWPAESQTELTAEQIVQRHLDAIGGSEKLTKIESLKKTGTYVYNGMEHPIVSYHKAGRRCREEIEGLRLWGTDVWEGQTVTRGTDGTVAWCKDESRPPEWARIPAEDAQLALEGADLHGALHDHKAKGHRVELLGRGDVDGTPTYLLKLTLASGIVQTWYLDLDSFEVLRIEVVAEEKEDGYAGLERPRAWHFDDYRPVNGVQMPFWIYVEEPIFAREYIFETIEANVTIDDDLFEPPEGSFISKR